MGKQTPEEEMRAFLHALTVFSPLVEANPRSMKRFVNQYGANRDLEILSATNVAGGDLGQQQMALWTIIEIRWPLLAEHLEHQPDSVNFIGKTPSDVPENLHPLFGDPDVLDVITGRGVDASLDEDSIRRITGWPVPSEGASGESARAGST